MEKHTVPDQITPSGLLSLYAERLCGGLSCVASIINPRQHSPDLQTSLPFTNRGVRPSKKKKIAPPPSVPGRKVERKPRETSDLLMKGQQRCASHFLTLTLQTSCSYLDYYSKKGYILPQTHACETALRRWLGRPKVKYLVFDKTFCFFVRLNLQWFSNVTV